MKKFLLFTMLISLVLFSQNVLASGYHINENEIDNLFENATESSMFSMDALTANSTSMALENVVDGKDPVIAIVLDVLLGGLGVHRFYLGTETISGLAYFLTCGGFGGIVPLIDLIVLIIDIDDISPYVNNPYFFMWKERL
jgi:TM2 domain-containing membrane protein YozV